MLGTSIRALWIAIAAGIALFSGTVLADRAMDPRNVAAGTLIHEHGYCDQPYVVVLPDGAWLCVFTTSATREGARSQYIVAVTSRDHGRTWSDPVPIEPPDGPEASWAMPLLTDFGRVHIFYVYNGDRIDALPDGRPARADMLGWYCAKYSDDGGLTWSERRRLPVRVTACDRGNDWGGAVQIFWGIGKPIVHRGGAIFAFTKIGRYMLDDGEGWFFRSDNILTERDAARVRWDLLPEGDHGVRAPDFGSVQEEHNIVSLEDGGLYCVYRTTLGHMAESYSRDNGRTWSRPEAVRYADGRVMKNPRACPRLWKTREGKYLLWFHNHGGTGFEDRNPAWISGGIEKDGRILWSQPEILLYSDDLSYDTGRLSYPDFIEADGRYWVTTTQKTRASIHEIDPALLGGLWEQDFGCGRSPACPPKSRATRDEGWDRATGPTEGLPRVPTAPSGFTLECVAIFDDLAPGQVILDTRDEHGRGIVLQTTGRATIELRLDDGVTEAAWECDPGALVSGKRCHIAVVVDRGPNIIQFMIDGVLCDGGAHRQYGWGRFPPTLGDVSGDRGARLAPSLRGRVELLRIYDRPLRTAELVGNYHLTGTGKSDPALRGGDLPVPDPSPL